MFGFFNFLRLAITMISVALAIMVEVKKVFEIHFGELQAV